MNKYEVMYVIAPTLEDSVRNELISYFSGIVEKNAGMIDRMERTINTLFMRKASDHNDMERFRIINIRGFLCKGPDLAVAMKIRYRSALFG